MKLKLIAALLLACASTHAVPLATYSFNGSLGSEATFAPDAQPSGAVVSSMARGSGVSPNAGAGFFSAANWTTDSSIDSNDYFTFSITPDAGFGLSLTGIALDERRSGTGIREWVVRSSLDGFSSNLAAVSVPDNTSDRLGQTINLSGSFLGLTSAIEFRLYGYAAEAAGGTWRLDNVKIEGSTQRFSTSSVPETLSLSFTACFLLGFVLLSRHIVSRPAMVRAKIRKSVKNSKIR